MMALRCCTTVPLGRVSRVWIVLGERGIWILVYTAPLGDGGVSRAPLYRSAGVAVTLALFHCLAAFFPSGVKRFDVHLWRVVDSPLYVRRSARLKKLCD